MILLNSSSKFARHVNISLPFDVRNINLGGKRLVSGYTISPWHTLNSHPCFWNLRSFCLVGWFVVTITGFITLGEYKSTYQVREQDRI